MKKENIYLINNNDNNIYLKYRNAIKASIIFLSFYIIDLVLGILFIYNFTTFIILLIKMILEKFGIFKNISITIDYTVLMEILYTMVFFIIILKKNHLKLYYKKFDFAYLKEKKILFYLILSISLNILSKFLKNNYNFHLFNNIKILTFYQLILDFLLGPILEETIYKGIIFELLIKLNLNIRIIIISLIFTFLHLIHIFEYNFININIILYYIFYGLSVFVYSIISFKIYIKNNNLLNLYLLHSLLNIFVTLFN